VHDAGCVAGLVGVAHAGRRRVAAGLTVGPRGDAVLVLGVDDVAAPARPPALAHQVAAVLAASRGTRRAPAQLARRPAVATAARLAAVRRHSVCIDFGRHARRHRRDPARRCVCARRGGATGVGSTPTHPHADSGICDHNYTAPANEQGPASKIALRRLNSADRKTYMHP
jgi:hypothetical protein